MPANITVVETGDFIRARPDGRLDIDASRKLLVEVIAVMRTGNQHNVLIDTRAAAPALLTRTDLWQLGIAVGTHPAFARVQVALLVPVERKDDAEFLETIARIEGANVMAFSDYENAITWLIMRGESAG